MHNSWIFKKREGYVKDASQGFDRYDSISCIVIEMAH